jgi:hypothetical protein
MIPHEGRCKTKMRSKTAASVKLSKLQQNPGKYVLDMGKVGYGPSSVFDFVLCGEWPRLKGSSHVAT